MEPIFNTNTSEIESKYERLLKLRDNTNTDNIYVKRMYELKYEELKAKFGISEESLKAYEDFKALKELKIKEEKELKTFFYNGIKFKSEAHLKEYLANIGFGAQIKFLFKGVKDTLILKYHNACLKVINVIYLILK